MALSLAAAQNLVVRLLPSLAAAQNLVVRLLLPSPVEGPSLKVPLSLEEACGDRMDTNAIFSGAAMATVLPLLVAAQWFLVDPSRHQVVEVSLEDRRQALLVSPAALKEALVGLRDRFPRVRSRTMFQPDRPRVQHRDPRLLSPTSQLLVHLRVQRDPESTLHSIINPTSKDPSHLKVPLLRAHVLAGCRLVPSLR